MRRLVAQEKGEGDPLDLKYAAGGQIDLDFLAQYLCLRHARESPDLLSGSTEHVLTLAGAHGLIAPADVEAVLSAYRLFAHVAQVLRTILDGGISLADADEAVKTRLAAVVNMPSFSQLAADVLENEKRVGAIFKRIVG
jgi:glutamate-ammonia-ligase adenylyltransferase